jgi:hypothetical protein
MSLYEWLTTAIDHTHRDSWKHLQTVHAYKQYLTLQSSWLQVYHWVKSLNSVNIYFNFSAFILVLGVYMKQMESSPNFMISLGIHTLLYTYCLHYHLLKTCHCYCFFFQGVFFEVLLNLNLNSVCFSILWLNIKPFLLLIVLRSVSVKPRLI